MRAGEGGVDQFARVRVALMHRRLRAMLGDVADAVDVAEVELGIDPCVNRFKRQRDDVDVAGALAIAEQGALDAVGAGHQRELRRGDRGAAIVMRMDGQVTLERSEMRRRTTRTGRHRCSASPSRPSPAG